LAATLFLASLACSAIPLRKGASWQWRRVDPTHGPVVSRIAKVVDSVGCDSGSLWTLIFSDSTNQQTWDSCSILERRDGTRRWWSTPFIGQLPWDPEPWNGDTFQEATTGWGMAWAEANGPSLSYSIQNPGSNSWVWSFAGWPWPLMELDLFEGYSAINLPAQEMDPNLGWSRGKFGEVEWILSWKDGVKLPASSRDTLRRMRLPREGSAWWWDIRSTGSAPAFPPASTNYGQTLGWDSVHTLGWKFLALPPDSEGWARATVAAAWDSGKPGSKDTLLDLRWNPTTGQRGPISRAFDPGLGDGFWEAWWDSVDGTGRTRGTYAFNYPMTGYKSDRHSYARLRTAGGLDSSVTIDDGGTDGITGGTDTWIRLLSVDGTPVRAATDGIARGVAGSGMHPFASLADLRRELSKHPRASVRIDDPSGRTATLPVPEASRSLSTRHGLILLELRDGAFRATGRLILP
jgi:hypothetical protein